MTNTPKADEVLREQFERWLCETTEFEPQRLNEAARRFNNRYRELFAAFQSGAALTTAPQHKDAAAVDACSKDGQPCYVGANTDDAHFRCGTPSCGNKLAAPAAQGNAEPVAWRSSLETLAAPYRWAIKNGRDPKKCDFHLRADTDWAGHLQIQMRDSKRAAELLDAAPRPASDDAELCQDEGCPHYGALHVCRNQPAPAAQGDMEPAAWSAVGQPDSKRLGSEVLLWKTEWVDEDFDPTGIRVGYFQEGEPGEELFVVARYVPDQECYVSDDLTERADWPTHWCPHIAPPGVSLPRPASDDARDAGRWRWFRASHYRTVAGWADKLCGPMLVVPENADKNADDAMARLAAGGTK